MNSKFTQKAQNALNAALSAACLFGHTYVGSEHLLLGIAQEKDSAAARILYSRGAAPEKLREKILAISGNGNESRISASDMTPCVKKIIEESAHLSAKYNQSYIGTEHLLAALIEEVDSVGVRVLELFGRRGGKSKVRKCQKAKFAHLCPFGLWARSYRDGPSRYA